MLIFFLFTACAEPVVDPVVDSQTWDRPDPVVQVGCDANLVKQDRPGELSIRVHDIEREHPELGPWATSYGEVRWEAVWVAWKEGEPYAEEGEFRVTWATTWELEAAFSWWVEACELTVWVP